MLKDGDKNAKKLLKDFPGKQKDTYVIPRFGLVERIFTREDFVELVKKDFDLLKFDKETHYTTYGDTKYKRNFYISYLKNKKI